ncbi:MAG TPA: hypothetical protein VMY37_24200 [Thermoguttaceae bacterium]|nr:hypothetical protein [Thermoguttaceae bacterium]
MGFLSRLLRRLLGGSCPASVGSLRRVDESAEAGDYIDESTALAFPSVLGGMVRRKVWPYEASDTQGIAVAYSCENGEATVFVARRVASDVPDGGDSDVAAREVERALSVLDHMEATGRYSSVKKYQGSVIRLGTAPDNLTWARAAFTARYKGAPLISMIYVTGLRNHVVKLRITSNDPRADCLQSLPSALGDLLTRQR